MKKRSIMSVVFYGTVLLILNLPLYVMDGRSCTIFQCYTQLKKEEAGDIVIVDMQMILLVIFQVVSLSYLVTVILRKNWHLNIAALFLSLLGFLMGQEGIQRFVENDMGSYFTAIVVYVCSFELIFSFMLERWDEAVREAKEQREKEHQEKEEKQRRLFFPGRYTRQFYRMAWKNFCYDWKDYILLIIGSMVTVTLLFTGLGCYQMMEGIHREEYFLVGDGLARVLWDAMIPMGICMVFLMVFVMVYYLRKWMESYSIFVTLGTRENALYGILFIEIVSAFLASLLLGFLVGNGIAFILRRLLESAVGSKEFLRDITWVTYAKTLGAMLVIYIFSLMVCRDVVREFHLIRAATLRIRREKLPQRNGKILCAAGALMMFGSLALYTQLVRHESVYLLGTFFAGLFLVLRYGGAMYLLKVKEQDRYVETLLEHNHLYHRSVTAAWYLVVLTALYVCGMFYYTFQTASVAAAEEPEELFPYDFVCIADEGDNGFFAGLEEKYGVKIVEYPMVRVANVDRTQSSEGMQPRPQGQQIGISETTYHQLKKQLNDDYKPWDMGLDKEGERVYIVHQQNRSVRAQPIDWTYGSVRPFLHIGLPCPSFSLNTKNPAFSQRIVAGEEIGSLIGCFREGNQENIVVFSDEYFAEAQEMWKYTNIYSGRPIEAEEERIEGVTVRQGPTRLVLLTADKNDTEALKQEMKELEARHMDDTAYNLEISSWYCKETGISDVRTEYLMKTIANSFVLVILLMSSLFLICVKNISEMEEKRGRAEFLKCMGMRRKERVHILKKELYLFYVVPAVLSIGVTVCFTAAGFYVRMYSFGVMKEYLMCAVWIWLGWLLAEGGSVWCLGRWLVRKVEGRDE